jgi:signal transduction histidine kinase
MSIWNLFPFPTLTSKRANGHPAVFEDGSLVKTPPMCSSCATKECIANTGARRDEINECRFGMNYVRIDEERLTIGLIVTGRLNASKKAKSMARRHRELHVTQSQLLHAVGQAASLGPAVVRDFESEKKEVIEQLKESPEMFDALSQQLRADFQENLSQSHDFIQLAKLVRGYAETLIQDKHPELSTEDGAEKLPIEGAIYFATELMMAKIDALAFLHEINLAHGGEKNIRIHPLILKYRRIYQWQAEQKELDLKLIGSSYGYCRYNPQAIGAVIQGLLDNMVKYAPAGSDATIIFNEDDQRTTIEFSSLGPRIEDDEVHKIFLPGFRAQAARGAASSGLGLGLATAKQISDAIGLDLSVEQAATEHTKYRNRYPTTFRIVVTREG